MQNKRLKKFLKKTQPNSGFTLTELLAGLFMSIFVTGALGFGLYQIMSATAREKAKTDVRNEASRAVEFISDELRRASAIEVDTSLANLTATDNPSTTDIDESVAPDFALPAGGTARLALQIPGVEQRVVYSVAPPLSSSSWQGPLVLYRWGPNLGSDGAYTNGDNPAAWSNAALIDGIDNTNQTEDCGGNSITYQGFFACVVDDDGDGVVEDGTVDTNGDGVVNADDSIDDVNGFGETAQIFLTGGIDADNVAGNEDNYTAQTQAVARAKNVTVSDAEIAAGNAISFKSLGADYTCHPNDVSTTGDDTTWTMRMDFDTNPYDNNTDNTTRWIHDSSRQSQPIGIDRDNPNDLTIYSVPISSSNCLSNGNEGATIADEVSGLATTSSFTIKFQETVSGRPEDANFYKTFNGNTTDDPDDDNNYNNPNVDPDGKIIVLKNGSVLKPVDSLTSIDFTSNIAPAPLYPGYDPDGPDYPAPYRQSLGEFLADDNNFPNGETYATLNGDGSYTINLEDNQRLVAFEIGQDNNGLTNDNAQAPGFDLQDNIVLMSHDVFEDNHTPDENEN